MGTFKTIRTPELYLQRLAPAAAGDYATDQTNYTDVDLSSIVGKRAALIAGYVSITGGSAAAKTVQIRENGVTDVATAFEATVATGAGPTVFQFECWTDDAGIIEVKSPAVTAGVYQIGITRVWGRGPGLAA